MCMTYSQQIHSTLNNLGARTAIRIYWENNCLWETFQELSVVESFLFYSVLSILFKSAFLMVFLIHLTCPPQTFFFLQHLMEENCSKDLGRTYAKLCGLYMHLISQALGDFFFFYLEEDCRFGYLKRCYIVNCMKQFVVLQFGNKFTRSHNNMDPLWMLLPFKFLAISK